MSDPLQWEEKAWGRVMHAFVGDHAAVSYLELESETRSSWHVHRIRANTFVVLSGEVAIEWLQSDGIYRRLLCEGDSMTIHVNIWHRFRVLRAGRMIEVYYPEMPHAEDDIERRDTGGDDWNNLEARSNANGS